ncbi:MAG: PAS domain S-box protein [Bacteroidia bacterium]|nr:PAS domain S-box protein [Bacteroidia bacterium]MDW8015074.1 PAS domain S-box protein [Bacteroidia bacterium]
MAREMAVVLSTMRPQAQVPTLQRELKIGIGMSVGVLLLGLGVVFWLYSDWRSYVFAGMWVAMVGGGGIVGWRLWRSAQRYKEAAASEAREHILRIEGRYKALVQYASDTFLILDKRGLILYVSPSVKRTLGYAPSDLEGGEMREIVHSEDGALLSGALERQSSAAFTLRLQHREGYWRYFEGVGQPFFTDPLIQGYLLTLRDVTDRKREEEQRREKEAAALRLAVERERAEYEKQLIEQSRQQLEKAYKIIEQKNAEIAESLQYAARIQQGMVTPIEVIRQYLPESFVFWRPRDVVSGDFYWFLHLDERIYIAAADCTGHGVPGALMTMIASATLTQAVLGEGCRSPDEILSTAHRLLRRALRQDVPGATSQDGMDIALLCFEGKRVFYAGAHRPLWIWMPDSQDVQEYPADRKGIGGAAAPAEQVFTLHVIEPPKGSQLYVSSDGYADQFGGPEGRKYMSKRFKRFLAQIAPISPDAQAEALKVELDAWIGHKYEQIDDILVIGVRV